MRDLTPFVAPRAIAIVGASSVPGKAGDTAVRLLLKHGFPGKILPIHPTSTHIHALPAFRDVASCGQQVDLAVLAVPQQALLAVMEDLAVAKVRAAVIFASGMAETGDEGKAQQLAIAKFAAEHGIALLGPNCLGAMSVTHKSFATFSPIPLAGLPPAGGVAIVSQSGAFGAYAFALARIAGLGISHWITTGNEADLQVADAIEWLAQDDATTTIMVYLEGSRDGSRLRKAFRSARAAGKPVVVTKVGKTESGARSAQSHTASLTGEDAVYQAVFDEYGVFRADTVDEFFRLGYALANGRKARSRALLAVTVSGGVGVMMADRAELRGLSMPSLPADVSDFLRQCVPFASTANPVDVTGQILSAPAVLGETLSRAACSGNFGCVALFLAGGLAAAGVWESLQDAIVKIADAGNPPALALCGLVTPEQKAWLEGHGCLVFVDPSHAIDALSALAGHPDSLSVAGDDVTGDELQVRRVDLSGHSSVGEAQAMEILRGYGVPVVAHERAASARQCAEAAARMGFPVAIKLLSSKVLHKTELGGVHLNINDAHAAHAAYDAIGEALHRRGLGHLAGEVMVARMVKGVGELFVGMRRDPVFGAVVVAGFGGTAVETFGRVAVGVAPLTRARAHRMLADSGVVKIIDGFRGVGPHCVDQAVDVLLALSRLAMEEGERIDTVEINPLVVGMGGLVAVDAVVALSALGDAESPRPSAVDPEAVTRRNHAIAA